MNTLIRFLKNTTGHPGKLLCLHLILFSVILVLLQSFQSHLLFKRDAIQTGEIWRILTGNLVHTNYYHLALNLAGVLFLCLLFSDYLKVRVFYISLLICSMSVGMGIYLFNPELQWYAGLSGALYGLFFFAASLALRHRDFIGSLPILIGIPAKLAWDSQHTNFTQHSAELINAPVATDAHIYGLIAGICISISMAIVQHKTAKTN